MALASWIAQAISNYYAVGAPTFGVPQCALEGIVQCENSGSGDPSGALATSGDGGAFGLGAGKTYETAAGSITAPSSLDQSTINQQILVTAALYAKDGSSPWGNTPGGDNDCISSSCNGSVPGATGLSLQDEANALGISLTDLNEIIQGIMGGQSIGTAPANAVQGDEQTAGQDASLATSELSVFGDLEKLIGDVLSGSFWKRIGLFTLGAGLVIVGVYLFAKQSDTVQQVEGGAGQAATLAALAA